MKATLFGHITAPVAAIVGVYDPFLPQHQELILELVSSAHKRALAAVAIVLDPAPPLLLYGASEWPVYEDFQVRLRRMRRCGLDSVVRVRLSRKDLDAGAADLLEVVYSHFCIKELWLGERQSLGVGPAGSNSTISALADQHKIRLRRLPTLQRSAKRIDVRQLLTSGHVAEARSAVGHPPVRSRPSSGRLRLAWATGLYRAIPLDRPEGVTTSTPLKVFVNAESTGLPSIDWPDREIRYLAFMSGPGDHPAHKEREVAMVG
jgi:FAD synthetase